MKIAAFIILVVAVAVLWFVAKSRAQVSTTSKPGAATPSEPKHVYAELRKTMLDGPRAKFGLPPTSKPTEPWGVLMDWGLDRGTVTVVAASDGSASVYLSSGGGFIGGKGQEPIRKAAQNAVEIARTVRLPSTATTSYPLPDQHGVFFYFLTDAGVFAVQSSETAMQEQSNPLSELGNAMQAIITQYQVWDSAKKSAAK